MTRSPAPRRRAFAVFLPLLAVLGALPLMAPTCGSTGEGYKIFAQRSLVIPMDVCYQYQTDNTGQTYTPAGGATECPATDPGDVIRAYGLVYQLIRNGIAVYWIIEPAKTSRTQVDFTIQYQGGAPVLLYDWATGGQAGAPTAAHGINYRGGPFVVDGSDYARASQVLQNFKATFQNVNVHVSNVSFRGYAKRTMAGGWSAGGTIPPKLALLDIGSDGAGAKNSEVVIRGYLTRAGLDTAGAAGTTAGPHGEIFDRLFMPDFLGTSYTDTNLHKMGYQILWVPHWAAPSSCSDCPPSTSCTCSVKYTAAQIQQALRNIGAFVNGAAGRDGGDLFAECAGLGSFEGVPGNPVYADGVNPDTHFQEETGLQINGGLGAAEYVTSTLSSPLMQIGDYGFKPQTGAIQRYRPVTSPYRQGPPPVQSLILDATATSPKYDIFTLLPRAGTRGSIVYLGGHSYSGTDGTFQVAGSRLVLNTLFNLGASCTATGVACTTGLAGVCSAGTYICQNGQPVCVPNVQPNTRAEICNGLDDDCDWSVDEGLQTDCYQPPPGYVDPEGRSSAAFAASKNYGVCRPGVSVCQNVNGVYQMSACTGQVLPSAETCNGLDDDCDGTVDDGVGTHTCYDGPAYSIDAGGTPRGMCHAGEQVCQNGAWGAPAGAGFVPGACGGQVLPRPEPCGDGGLPGGDYDCDGQINNGCTCNPFTPDTMPCFTGPGIDSVGVCRAGRQTCISSGGSAMWGPCNATTSATAAASNPTLQRVADLVTPETCVSLACAGDVECRRPNDTNCDNSVPVCTECTASQTEACYGGPPAYRDVGQCKSGTRTCAANGTWGACLGYVLPSTDAAGNPLEYCDGKDNDCDWAIDDGAICPAGFACIAGVCVAARCGLEVPPPEGYACDAGNNVIPGVCGSAPCAIGTLCQYGTCIDPCPVDSVTGESQTCGSGTVCGGGACIGGGCYEAGCPTGKVCSGGICAVSPCAGVSCPTGTFCRAGDCVQACTFVSCGTGQKCGIDGFCEPDPCAGRLCSAGQRCTSTGACAPDPCLGKGCATGQICDPSSGEAVCADDPCADVVCPAGVCVRGQCYPAGNLTGAGRVAPGEPGSGGCGCGSGPGAALPALLLLLAAPLFRRGARRRIAPPGTGLVLLLAAALAASGCKESNDASFDPSTCADTCGEQRCVDVQTDPTHCGGCDRDPCAAGQQCVDGVCGPSSAVAPYLRSLTPSSGPKDNPDVLVAVAGERFQTGATVRITTPGGMRTFTCTATPGATCEWLSATALRVHVDLSGATESTWQFRIVNPDRVISNAVAFPIVVPIPAVATVAPNPIDSGTSATLTVTPTAAAGSGFTSGSQCRIEGAPSGEMALSSVLAGTDLQCFLPAPGLPPGSYPLSVVSEKGVRSNRVTLTVAASDPVVYSVDPNTSTTTVLSFSVTGARFDTTSRVLFYLTGTSRDAAAPLTTTYFDSTRLYVSNYAAPGNGNYTVAVRNGTTAPYKYSNGVPFSIGTTAPSISAFTPSFTYQGEPAVALSFTGTGFPADSVIELQRPEGSPFSALASTTSCTPGCTVSATRSFVGEPDGTWYARLRYGPPGSATSAPWTLRVLSNQAILRGYTASPAPADSGAVGSTKTSITFQVANIRGPRFQDVRVRFWDPSNASSAILVRELDPSPDPSAASTTLTVPTGISLAGLLPGTYMFTVHNPNASESNALPFTVTPGMPTLTSVCQLGTNCVRELPRSDTPVSVKLTGTNFARPDVNGNGSQVMVTAWFMNGFPTPDPCVANTAVEWEPVPASSLAVTSATEMVLTFDSRAAYVDPTYGTTYYVGVWNPGGASGPQKSSCGQDPRSLPWFKILAQ